MFPEPELDLEQHVTRPDAVVATLTAPGARSIGGTIHWGDTPVPSTVAMGVGVIHSYAYNGWYQVVGTVAPLAAALRWHVADPAMPVVTVAGVDGLTVTVQVVAPEGRPPGGYRIDWGDGRPATAPDSSGYATHMYGVAGDYELRVRDYRIPVERGSRLRLTLPLPLMVDWQPDPADLFTIQAWVSTAGWGGAAIDWGDGSPVEPVPEAGTLSHRYELPGRYELTGIDGETAARTTTPVVIKTALPTAYAFLDSSDDWQVLLWVDEPADETAYLVDWGDGSPPQPVCGQRLPRVPPLPRVPHLYDRVNTWTVQCTDTSTRRTTTLVVATGAIGILFTSDAPARPRLDALWLKPGARYTLDPGDGTVPHTGIVPASARITDVRGIPLPPGEYRLVLREYVDGALRREAVRRYVQPSQWDWLLGVDFTWRDPADPLGIQTVRVSAPGARVPCRVQWGDGTPDALLNLGATASHQYVLPAPQQGYRLRVTEQPTVDQPRTFTRVLGEPRYVGVPVLNGRANGAVDLDVAGIDQEYNDDWYQLTWGDGTTDPVGAVGRWYPAHHDYKKPGTYQIAVDAPGMAVPVTRTVTVVEYPAPQVSVAEARDSDGKLIDPDRRTVQVNVDNRASGGMCAVRLGDGSPLHNTTTEVESWLHKYAAPGTYYVIATSLADPTAKGRAVATVPFGDAQTLTFVLGPDPADPSGMTWMVTVTGRRPGLAVLVDWGETGAEIEVPPSNVLTNRYDEAGMYVFGIRYDDRSETYTDMITVPAVRSVP